MSANRKNHSNVERDSVLRQYDSKIPFCPSEIKSTTAKRLLERHKEMKRQSQGHCIGKESINLISDDFFLDFLLLSTAKICFFSGFDDSELVGQVLKEGYEFYGHFHWVFQYGCALKFGYSKLLIAQPCPWKNNTTGLAIIEYFLHHATKERLIFGNFRFVDVMLTPRKNLLAINYATEATNPALFLSLLRYGAQVKFYGRERRGIGNPLMYYFEQLHHFLKSPKIWMTVTRANPNTVVQCFNVVLRDIPQIKLENIKNNLINYEIYADSIKDIMNRCEVPKVQSRLFSPPELQHLCRCAIRKCLSTNCMLPIGIQKLPITERFRRYIDLFED